MEETKQKKTENTKIDSVQIEGLVALKIIKHCQEEGATEDSQGVLLGLLVDTKLEITNCFPYPKTDDDEYDDMNYQIEMMRKLRDVNVDHFHVGWYQSTILASFLNRNFVESQFHYQNSISESVVIVYDPLQTHQGILSFKAYRLTEVLMDLWKSGKVENFSPDGLSQRGVHFDNLFEEIPVVLKNSNLMNTLVCEIEDRTRLPDRETFLSLATGSYLEKSVHRLIEGVDELCQDAQKLHNYQRNYANQQHKIEAYKQKKETERNMRIQRGEEPPPEEDLTKLFRPIQPPSRLDNLLMTSQIGTYCEQLNEFASQSFAKLFVAEAVQKQGAVEQ